MISIHIENLNEFLQKFSKIDTTKTFQKSIKQSIIYTQGIATKETPIDKWFLRDSYQTEFSWLKWKLVNTRAYWVAVHEWHKQEVWRFVPAIWKRLKQSFVKWNPFLTRTAKIAEGEVNMIFNKNINGMLNTLR